MKKFSILKTPKSNFATIFAIIFALLTTITISCTNNLTETSPESSYDYILGEYQTSLGKLVITSTENYILTEENTQLATDVKYNYNGTFEVSVLSTYSTSSDTQTVTSYYYKDNAWHTVSSLKITRTTSTIHKISVNKKSDEIKEFIQTTFEAPSSIKKDNDSYNFAYNSYIDTTFSYIYNSQTYYIYNLPHTEITEIDS